MSPPRGVNPWRNPDRGGPTARDRRAYIIDELLAYDYRNNIRRVLMAVESNQMIID